VGLKWCTAPGCVNGRVLYQGMACQCSECKGSGFVDDPDAHPDACIDCGAMPGEVRMNRHGRPCALCMHRAKDMRREREKAVETPEEASDAV
jgi:hypothetical protein